MHHSTILDAAPDTVWAEVRDPMKVVKIVSGPAVKNVSWTEGGALERVPSRYDFTPAFNEGLVQQETAGRNEVERSSTYRVVAPTMDILSCAATSRPAGDQRSGPQLLRVVTRAGDSRRRRPRRRQGDLGHAGEPDRLHAGPFRIAAEVVGR
jgi:hypothetical protein